MSNNYEKALEDLQKTFAEIIGSENLNPVREAYAQELRADALEAVLTSNEKIIQRELGSLARWMQNRAAYVQELLTINEQLRAQIPQVKKEGERPTVPTANAHLATDK